MLIPDMREKLFLLDWGQKQNGSRFAITTAPSKEALWISVDTIGDPSGVKAMEIANGDDGEGFYVELTDPKKAYATRFDEHRDTDDYPEDKFEDIPSIFDEERKEWFSVC